MINQKLSLNQRTGSMRFFGLTPIFLGFGILSLHGQDFSMFHKNTSAQINITNANAGVLNWSVDGVNSLSSQRFFYRIGASPEALLQSISSTPTVVFTQNPTISRLDVTYANGIFSARTLFQLIGTTPGSGSANLNETITIQNLSGAPLDFHLFQYSDFNLGGVAGGQTAQFQFDGFGQPYKVIQTDGMRTVTETVNANTAPIGHFEAGLDGTTLGSLTDLAATTLNDTITAGPGNATFTYQWDVVLAPNETITISKLMNIVPEPGVATFAILSLVGMFAMRKQSRRS
jgi:hypothetical protein